MTGAGVSAESGIPTFRDAMEGLWARFDPMQLATPEAFAANPELVTRWYDHRRMMCAACDPNPAHETLTHMQRVFTSSGCRFTLITQNVDRLHQRAGSDPVIELHGSLFMWRCTGCGRSTEQTGVAFETYPPTCEACGGCLRPGVVWFHEMLPEEAIGAAQQAAGACDVFLSIGTSSMVYPAAGLVGAAHTRGARTAEINRDETPISGSVDWHLRGAAGRILPALAESLSDSPKDF